MASKANIGDKSEVDVAAKDGVGSESESEQAECSISEVTSVVQIDDDLKTPKVYRRQRNKKPSKVQQSPFIAGSGLSKVGSTYVKHVKGRSSLMPSINILVEYDFMVEFSSFVDKNMITKKQSVAVYSDDDHSLDPSYDFEVYSVSSKTWFHTLNYSGKHLDVIFYYLRKKAKYGNMPIRAVITDNFLVIVIRSYTKNLSLLEMSYLITKASEILEYMYGYRLFCNTAWTEVGHVFFPYSHEK